MDGPLLRFVLVIRTRSRWFYQRLPGRLAKQNENVF